MSESLHPRADELDEMRPIEFLEVMHAEDAVAVAAIRPQLPQIARAVEAVAERIRSGGRLHYFGAGSSGQIATLDAAECPITFGLAQDLVQAHSADEPHEEDDRALGAEKARDARLGPNDAVVGITASGRTQFVLGALDEAARRGSLRIALVCNVGSPVAQSAAIAIEVDTGPEVIAGSTRLKGGTVQKLVLNMLSTAVFTRLGRTYRGRMIGVAPSNEKLRVRASRIVADLTGVSLEEARRRLDDAGGDVRAAMDGVRHR